MKSLSLTLFLIIMCGSQYGQDITIDLEGFKHQLDALDGASVCQFSGITWLPEATTRSEYDNLAGFPDDDPSTRFGLFMDVCFSGKIQKGMALHQLWATPCVRQTPENAVGDSYSDSSWHNLDFRMYESSYTMSPPEGYVVLSDDHSPSARGYTVPVFLAALKRARMEGYRMMFRLDVHFSYPSWMFGNDPSAFLPAEKWEEAALHYVYLVKYLVSKHGIPVHIVSLMNEPDYQSRDYNHLTPQLALQFAAVLRAKLDEAGLQGVRIDAGHWLNDASLMAFVTQYRSPENTQFRSSIDAVGNHTFGGQAPWAITLDDSIRTPIWVNSGGYSGYWNDAEENLGFLMGPDDRIDETISLELWRVSLGQTLQGSWSLRRRAGMSGRYLVPSEYDPYHTGTTRQIDGAATVNPYVRPGMFILEGSTSNHPVSGAHPYNVAGFGGRGFNEVIIITNNQVPGNFAIRLLNNEANTAHLVQCDESGSRIYLGETGIVNGVLSVSVPANSVTTCILNRAHSRRRGYVIVKDASNLSSADQTILTILEKGLEVVAVSQYMSSAEQSALGAKRHPVDAMGAAFYMISPSVDDSIVGYAYRSAMAPVISLNEVCSRKLGISTGSTIEAGKFLSFCDPMDPPAEMLDSLLPRACGTRISLPEDAGERELKEAVLYALEQLVQCNPVTSKEVEQLPAIIFPNPAKDRFTIRLEGESASLVSIYDITGTEIFRQRFTGREAVPDTDLSDGTYIILVRQNGSMMHSRLVICK